MRSIRMRALSLSESNFIWMKWTNTISTRQQKLNGYIININGLGYSIEQLKMLRTSASERHDHILCLSIINITYSAQSDSLRILACLVQSWITNSLMFNLPDKQFEPQCCNAISMNCSCRNIRQSIDCSNNNSNIWHFLLKQRRIIYNNNGSFISNFFWQQSTLDWHLHW